MSKANSAAPAMLSRAAILAAVDTASEDVAVPEWGGVVRVRGLTASERDQWEASLNRVEFRNGKARVLPDRGTIRARLVSYVVVDPDSGGRLFSEGDVGALAKKAAAPISRIYDVACRLSGITAADQEELEGNSDATAADGSRSD
jgi:hypothetical protein